MAYNLDKRTGRIARQTPKKVLIMSLSLNIIGG